VESKTRLRRRRIYEKELIRSRDLKARSSSLVRKKKKGKGSGKKILPVEATKESNE